MNTSVPTVTIRPGLDLRADVIVLGLADGTRPSLVGSDKSLDAKVKAAFGGTVAHLVDAVGGSSKPESVVVLPGRSPRVVVVGLGDADVTPTILRGAVATALRHVAGLPDVAGLRVCVSLELADPELVEAAVEGAVLGAHRTAQISREQSPAPVAEVSLVAPKGLADAAARAAIAADAVCTTRDWVNQPGNLLYPEVFANEARALLAREKVAVEVLDERALAKGGYGGILAVGGGSSHAPRLVRMHYAPRGARAHLAFVGKGITFDSGGLDLKPAGQMAGMKYDMAGAAAVITAVRAIAAMGLPITVTGYAAMAENLPSGTSYRSGDVLTMFDGQTVENYNTDAEGRLVMADAIARAGQDSPDLIVDVATLTGACMVALGMRTAGLMATDDATADQLLDAAEAAGEPLWQLPITEDVREKLKSDIADTRSGGKDRYAGALVAGAFLQRFVPEGTAWAHLDIAGPGDNDAAPHGWTPKGATGFAVRTLIALARQLAG